MFPLCLYLIPFVICALFLGFWLIGNISSDIEIDGCMTFGTLFKGLGFLIVTATPVANVVMSIFIFAELYDEFRWNIDDFLGKPICSIWRKK